MQQRVGDGPSPWKDPLVFLPRKPLQEFPKRQEIYGPERPCGQLYLVVLGRVAVTTAAGDGGQTVGRLVRPEGFFGESALVGAHHPESAVALDRVTAMSWTRDEIEAQVQREPRLGLALSQYLVRECLELQDRIESMACHKTPERVMLALLQLAADLGTPQEDGSTRLGSLTHNIIADFVGTSREIVTAQMNRMRRQGLIHYSRRHIDVQVKQLETALLQEGVSVAQGPSKFYHVAGF